jgi:hypothetical protein
MYQIFNRIEKLMSGIQAVAPPVFLISIDMRSIPWSNYRLFAEDRYA